MTVATSGGGVVQSSPPGIDCGSVCQTTAPPGGLSLIATPASGFEFAGWTGVCSGTVSSCFVPAAGAAIATFRRLYQITADADGDGGVALAVVGKSRTLQVADGSVTTTSDQSVTLTATPNPGSHFDHWSGACSGSAPTCTTSGADTTRTLASFAAGGPTTIAFPFYVTRRGAGLVHEQPVGNRLWRPDAMPECVAARRDGDADGEGERGHVLHRLDELRRVRRHGPVRGRVPGVDKRPGRNIPEDELHLRAPAEAQGHGCSRGAAASAATAGVALTLSTAALVRLQLQRPGLNVLDHSYLVKTRRQVFTSSPIDLTVPVGPYTLSVSLTNSCSSPPPLVNRVTLPVVGG